MKFKDFETNKHYVRDTSDMKDEFEQERANKIMYKVSEDGYLFKASIASEWWVKSPTSHNLLIDLDFIKLVQNEE